MEVLRDQQEYITRDGSKFRISKYDCLTGREIMFKYSVSNLPKLGEYQSSQEVALKSMGFVEKELPNGKWIRLETPLLVKQHVTDWEQLVELEYAMIKYNFSFFQNGATSSFLQSLSGILEEKVIKILTALLDSWFQKKSQLTGNSTSTTP